MKTAIRISTIDTFRSYHDLYRDSAFNDGLAMDAPGILPGGSVKCFGEADDTFVAGTAVFR